MHLDSFPNRILVSIIFLFSIVFLTNAQDNERKPKEDLSTPYDAILTFTFYLDADHYNLKKASKVFQTKGEEARDFTVRLKQILDGKGQKFKMSSVPEDAQFLDSVNKKNVYVPFPEQYPEIYLERNKDNGKWQFSRETERQIPDLHRKVFPFGSHHLLRILPKLGSDKFLGLAFWQYFTILLFFLAGTLIHQISSRLFSFIISILANSRFGKNHFDNATVDKIGIALSYLLVCLMVFIFFPVLQLPPGFGYVVLILLRLTNTVLVVLLTLRIIHLFRSYLSYLALKSKNPTDENLIPIVIRIVNIIVIVAGVFHALSIFNVNVTALIAGLSIGGLAIALAAQETVKNLIGSMMIYADRPFKIGDLITVGSVTGVIEDIGFRSTRIRTLDTSLVSVPNGNLMNETINNLGERKNRRFNTNITVAYHTPPELLEKFVSGLREIALTHPEIEKEDMFIHLNNLNSSSMDIIFHVYFKTNEWGKELQWREEVIMLILHLAKELGVNFAYPSTSLYIESMPDKKSNIPEYKDKIEQSDKKLSSFVQNLKGKFSEKSEDTDLESTENNY